MPAPPVPISQPPDAEFLWTWLQSITASAAPGGSVDAVQYKATATTFGGVGPLTNGQLVIGHTGAAPAAASLTPPAAGITITGGTGSITFALADDLAAVEGLSTNGLAVRTATSAWITRAIAAGSAKITVANGDGIAGNPAIDVGIVPSSSIQGTATNDNAAAGYIGEFQNSVVLAGAAIPLTTATPANVTTLNLTAGDWDVSGEVWFAEDATTVATVQIGAINTVSATLPTDPGAGTALTRESATTVTGLGSVLRVGPARLSLSGTTAVYLVAQATFTVSTNAAYGILRARRMR